MLLRNIIVIILIAISSIISAKDYYVSPSGSNSNPGTISQPFKTIGYAESKMAGGDILFVHNGIYNEKIAFDGVSGTAEDPTIIMAYPGDTPVIDGEGIHLGNGSALVMMWDDYAHIVGFEIRNSMQNGIISIGTNCLISNCKIHDCQQAAIAINGDYGIAEYCEGYNLCMANENGRSGVEGGWGFGISACRYPSYAIIRHCIVHDCWGEGISTGDADHTIIEDNIVYDCYSVHLYISDATDCIAQRNLVFSTKNMADGYQTGIGLYDEEFVSYNNVIINNVVHGCRRNFSASIPEYNAIVANNTFVNSIHSSCVWFYDGEYVNFMFVNNIIIQENNLPCIRIPQGSGIILSNNMYNKSYDSRAAGQHDIIADPMFTKSGGDPSGAEFYKLRFGSPAINAGKDIRIYDDFLGQERDEYPDIGAFEYSATDASVKVTEVSITGDGGKTEISRDRGTLQLTASIFPANAADKTVTWSIINVTGKATISINGLITAVSNGKVFVKATSNDGSGKYGILLINISGQNFSGNSRPANYSNLAVKIYPNPASNIINVKIDDEDLTFDLITVLNFAGEKVYHSRLSKSEKELQIPIIFKKGAYLIQLSLNNITLFCQKLIVNN